MKYRTATAFTLIELLVVISIIALLVAILLPALSGAREAAQSTTCLSNLRQISIGVHSYVETHDGYYPLQGYGGIGFMGALVKELQISVIGETSANATYAPGYYTRNLYAKGRNNGIFQCPTETGAYNNTWGGENSTSYRWNGGLNGGSYGMGLSENYNGGNYEKYWGNVHDTDVKGRTTTIVMGDGIWTNGQYEYENAGLSETRVSDYHQGGANFLWVDGHASHLHKDDIISDYFDRRK